MKLDIHAVFQDHVNNRLDPTLFPYVKDQPSLSTAPSLKATPSTGATSLRSAKPSWHRAAKPGAAQEVKQRVLVFVAGGMTYSEMREAYQLSKSLNKDIIIGMRAACIPGCDEAHYLCLQAPRTH